MSVDISQLTARLDPQRQEAIKQQYEERATSPTAAFLLCFFLGSAGVHRFYLREWRLGFAHLALFLAGMAALIAGLIQTLPLTVKLSSHPLGALLDAVGVVLLLIALVWEIIDLGRIDHQVYQRNLLLAEGIIAGTLLSDHSLEDAAAQRLEAVGQRAHEQAQAAGAPLAPVAGAAVAGAGLVAAEQNAGNATISYSEVSRVDVSADPDQARQASADAAREGDWMSTATTVPETQPGEAPVAETITRTHTEDGPRVTDSYEVDHVSGPSALEVAGLGAAGLGAAALGAGVWGATHEAGFDEPTQPEVAPQAETAPQFAQEGPAFDPTTFDTGDVTDANMPAVVAPAADIAVAHASPAYVQLPEEQTDLYGGWAPEAAAAAAPLYLTPEEPAAQPYSFEPQPLPEATDYYAPRSEEPPADSFVPPVASVYSGATEAPAAQPPSWDQPTTPQQEPAHDSHLGEWAGLAGVVGAGALAGEALAHSHTPEAPAAEPVPEPPPEPVVAAPPPPPAPEPPKMKKIRVRRKVVVDGQVVAEEVVEREIPADMDSATAAAQIQAELGHLTPEQIAERAHLSPDEEVELRQRSEGLGGGQ